MTSYRQYIRANKRKAYKGDASAMYAIATTWYPRCGGLKPARYFRCTTYWLKKAEELNHKWAALLLGHIFSRKDNPHYSLSTAIRYYKKAVKLGQNDAVESLLALGVTPQRKPKKSAKPAGSSTFES